MGFSGPFILNPPCWSPGWSGPDFPGFSIRFLLKTNYFGALAGRGLIFFEFQWSSSRLGKLPFWSPSWSDLDFHWLKHGNGRHVWCCFLPSSVRARNLLNLKNACFYNEFEWFDFPIQKIWFLMIFMILSDTCSGIDVWWFVALILAPFLNLYGITFHGFSQSIFGLCREWYFYRFNSDPVPKIASKACGTGLTDGLLHRCWLHFGTIFV